MPLDGERCGFLEVAPGVRSSSRLLALLLFMLTAVVVVYTGVYVLKTDKPDAGVVQALVAMVVALGGWGAMVQSKRRDE